MKTEYDKDQGLALVESDEEAVDFRSVTPVMVAKQSAAIFVGPYDERFRKNQKE